MIQDIDSLILSRTICWFLACQKFEISYVFTNQIRIKIESKKQCLVKNLTDKINLLSQYSSS